MVLFLFIYFFKTLFSFIQNTNGSNLATSNQPPPFPQSLEQLLERQWEQGSQFLMEQAQHFDSK